jgi:protein SCO1/2
MKRLALIAVALLWLANCAQAAERRTLTGLVLKVDLAHKSMLVSCNSIPGYMDAMVMSFPVRDAKLLDGIHATAMIEFHVLTGSNSPYAEDIRVVGFESVEQEPQEAQRLKLLRGIVNPEGSRNALAIGDLVPDFTFTDQNKQAITFSQFKGNVVVLTFIYTRCPNPNYCFRLNSNLGRLQKRFPERLGRDLTLLSIVVDPEHDQGNTLSNYAHIWNANSQGWHFLTGQLANVQEVTRMFGMDFWSGEGAMTHTFHTIVIDQQRKLAANLDGNQFTAKQLGDLVETMLPTVH